MYVNYPFHWCSPGGSFEIVELAVYRDQGLPTETRQDAARRAALREVIEEAGGGSFVGHDELPGFNIEPLVYQHRTARAEHYDNCVIPPGMLQLLQEPNLIRPLCGNKTVGSSQMFVYLIDSFGLDREWGNHWIPRARVRWRDEIDENYNKLPNVHFGYTWVELEHVLAYPDKPVAGSSMPLVPWDQKWFTDFQQELIAHISDLKQQQNQHQLLNYDDNQQGAADSCRPLLPVPLLLVNRVPCIVQSFVDEIQRRGIRVVAFDFDGVMVPGDGNYYQGLGLHSLSHGFLALADELNRRGLYMAIVSNNHGGNIRDNLSKGQPTYLLQHINQLAQTSNIFYRLMSQDIEFTELHGEYLPMESYDEARNFLGSNLIRKRMVS